MSQLEFSHTAYTLKEFSCTGLEFLCGFLSGLHSWFNSVTYQDDQTTWRNTDWPRAAKCRGQGTRQHKVRLVGAPEFTLAKSRECPFQRNHLPEFYLTLLSFFLRRFLAIAFSNAAAKGSHDCQPKCFYYIFQSFLIFRVFEGVNKRIACTM